MRSIGIRVEGADQLAKALADMPKRVGRSTLREALVSGGELIANTASANAPREPGAPDLAENIGISNTRPSDGSVGIAIGPIRGFFYGYFQEFGTVRHGAQAFMRPAFDTENRRTLQIIGGALWQAIIARGGFTARGSGGGMGENIIPPPPPRSPISGGPGGGML